MSTTSFIDPSEALRLKRQTSEELEYAIAALDRQIEVLADELREVEGDAIYALVGTLTGGRRRQIDKIHQLQGELQQRRTEMQHTLESLASEIAALQSDVAAATPDQSKSDAAANPGDNVTRAREAVRMAQAAADACDEVRRDLLSEMENVGSMGRCRVTEANRALKMLAGRVRKRAADECAQRVRQGLTRLQRRIAELMQIQPGSGDLAVMNEEIARLGQTFSGAALSGAADATESAAWLHDRLQTVAMLLEQAISIARRRLSEAEHRLQRPEGLHPQPTELLLGDAVETRAAAQE